MTSTGASVAILAIPTIAVSRLHSSSSFVSLLFALSLTAASVSSLPAGVLSDRWDPRIIISASMLCNAAAVALIPALTFFGIVSEWWLVVVLMAAMVAATCAEVAGQAFVPALARSHEYLAKSNAQMVASRSLGESVGPSLGGVVISAVGSAWALLADVACQLAAAGMAAKLPAQRAGTDDRMRERPRRASGFGAGSTPIRLTWGNPMLRRVLIATSVFNIGGGAIGAVYLVYAYRVLGLSPTAVGLTAGLGSLCIIGGTIAGRRVAAGQHASHFLLATSAAASCSFALILAAGMSHPLVMLTAYQMMFGVSVGISRVLMSMLRQLVTTVDLQGRVFAFMRLGPLLSAPLGGFLCAAGLRAGLSVHLVLIAGLAAALVSPLCYARPSAWTPSHLHPDPDAAASI